MNAKPLRTPHRGIALHTMRLHRSGLRSESGPRCAANAGRNVHYTWRVLPNCENTVTPMYFYLARLAINALAREDRAARVDHSHRQATERGLADHLSRRGQKH